MGYPRSERRGMVEWAAALTAHNSLLRGGEIGRVDTDAWDPQRCIAWTSIKWMSPCKESRWRPWLMIYITSIKDVNKDHKRVGLPISRRASWAEQPILCADPMDTYDAILRVWRTYEDTVPVEYRTYDGPGRVPFFTGPTGKAWTTSDSHNLARKLASNLGFNPLEFGGKFAQVGGATDMREMLGDASHQIIKQRGRWDSDITAVYQRALVSSMLEASVKIGGMGLSRDMEELEAGWSQPAHFR